MLLFWPRFGRISLACCHQPEKWLGLRVHFITKSKNTSPKEPMYDSIILCLDKQIFHLVYFYRRGNLLFPQKKLLFHSHQIISFIFKKPYQHSQRLWFQCKLHILILFKMSSGNWTSSPQVCHSVCQVYTGVAQEYIAISNISVVGLSCVNRAQQSQLNLPRR